MAEKLPVVYIARHGNPAWTQSGQHTGLADLPLTPDGERNAMRLGERLKGMSFAKVFTSPPTWDLFREGAPEGRPHKSVNERTVWWNVSVMLRVMYFSFPAGILFGCSLRAGWGLVRELAEDIFC